MLNEEILKAAAKKYAAEKSSNAKIREGLESAFMEGVNAMARCKSCYTKKTPEELDRRVKLPKAKREELVKLRKTMNYTYETLAQMFGISNAYAQALCKPQLMKLNKYYAKRAHTSESKDVLMARQKDTLAYKRTLAAQDLL